ncbi:unnamed protein product [Rangifer tarandus platyrhynchus]|uniref:Uncharacterized protein n=1 Tax=Rangifer tarandus platyrhynchus TaxID=3082113 RepID=A0ABN8XPX7_RANTA|nr:unnamed protein product [Rangifer tarandus platyrhynchus]
MVYLALMYATCYFIFFSSQVGKFLQMLWVCIFHISYISFLYVCMHEVASVLSLCDPVDCSPSDSSIHGILQTRKLEWVAMPSSRGSSQPQGSNRSLLHPLHWRWVLYF